MINFRLLLLTTAAVAMTLAQVASAQTVGPSTLSTPYVRPTQAGTETISILTVDNTGVLTDDTVPKAVTGSSYGMAGIPDGLGAFDNGDGTFTVLLNHEIGNLLGTVRDHGSIGAYVSKWIINKSSLQVLSGDDLMKQIFAWNAVTQASNTTVSTFAFNRFCSADLPEVSAFYNAASGLGSQERIFMHGEEGGATGYQNATVVTGSNAGKSYILGKFNLSTNGSGLTGVGGWENALANPFPQDKTIVLANNDGGTGIVANSVSVYVGTKTNTGSEVDKAGLTNGTLSFINVTGLPVERTSTVASATPNSVANGTRFTLSSTTSTTFSRPEDGAWNPLNPREYYFVTTDRIDQVSDGVGTQVGQTRLWRLTFDDITNPSLGGKVDILIDGQTVAGQKVNMFDNITVNKTTGRIILQEDVGNAAHNGKMWEYNPSTFTGTTNAGSLTQIMRHETARFGDIGIAATSPFNQDEETSGVIDVTSIMANSSLNKGNPGETWYLSVDQAHYTTGVTPTQVEGGQIFMIHQIAPLNNVQVTRSGYVRDRRTGTYAQQVTITNNTTGALTGPFYVVLDSLSANATLANPTGTTTTYAPLNAPYILVPGASLAPGASANVSLQFTNPSNAAISYTTRTLNSIPTP
jgi:hypothetical protein